MCSPKSPDVEGRFLVNILRELGINFLFHSNSFPTSRLYIENNALLSREYVENNSLFQTPQRSDFKDKENGVWNLIFLNFVDIHRNSRNACFYGPISFEFDINIIQEASYIYITKSNPEKWDKIWDVYSMCELIKLKNESKLDRYFFGCFDHMLMLKTETGLLQFDNYLHAIVIDRYKCTCRNLAIENLTKGVDTEVKEKITERVCETDCKCAAHYENYDNYKKVFSF